MQQRETDIKLGQKPVRVIISLGVLATTTVLNMFDARPEKAFLPRGNKHHDPERQENCAYNWLCDLVKKRLRRLKSTDSLNYGKKHRQKLPTRTLKEEQLAHEQARHPEN